MIRTTIFCALALLALTAQAHAAEQYPRISAYLIGDPRNYEDADYQEKIAKLDVAILSVWPGWERSHGTTIEEVTKRIKAINPSTKVFLYFIPESLLYPVNPAYKELGAKIDANKWWLYKNGSGGSKVLSDFGRDTFILNMTAFTPTDSDGRRANQWLPTYVRDTYIAPYPSIDGTFTDNVFWKPRRDGDWNRDGSTDDQNDATVQKWYREGYRTYMSGLQTLMPDKLHIANIADWGHPTAVLTEYDQLLPGGIMEAILGKSYSVESQRGWSGMLAHYRKSMNALAAPKLGIFHQFGSPSDFQAFRYGFTTTLLDDGLYAFSDDDRGYAGLDWFDEFDVKLGTASGAPPTAAWKDGVWRRDFQNGIVLVNPKGNGNVEVTLEGEFRKVAGKQDRAVNSGQVVRTVKLRDRDGIVLMRMQKRPRAPGGVRISTG